MYDMLIKSPYTNELQMMRGEEEHPKIYIYIYTYI